LLTESVILGVAGGALGLALGWLSLGFLKSMMPADTPRLAEVAIDRHVLAFSTVLSFAVGLIFGTLPAFQASRPDIEQVLRANASTSGSGRKRSRISAILVIAEIALAVVLVSDAGLFLKSLWRLSSMNTGVLEEEHLLIGNVTPSWAFYQSGDQCAGFYREVLESAGRLPGVKSAALADTLPLENAFGGLIAAKDQPQSLTSPYAAWSFTVSPGYLKTMGIPLLQGRDFTMTDRKGSPGVVLVSRSLAAAMWPGQNPIGRMVGFAAIKEKWSTVVGMVEDVQHYSSSPGFNSGARGDIYTASTQGSTILPYFLNIIVRSEGDLPDMRKQIVGAIGRINSNVPISKWRTMRQIVARSTATPRSTTWLFMILAGLALVLGLVGIYSVISYTVVQRTREIGIRIALGADRPRILRMIVRQGAALALIGLALGTAGAIAVNRVISSQLYDVKSTDPLTYAIVAVLVAIAAILATLVPSFRATKVNPTVALHCE
jgi:predicted permease